MLATKYSIIARYMDGVRVIGYMLEDTNGGHVRMSKQAVEKLALNKQIINCTAQRYDNGVVLKGIGCKISQLKNICLSCKESKKVDKRGEIVKRVINGKNTIGYVILTYNGDSKTISRDKTLEFARNGAFKNARAQMSKNEILLRGVNCELAKLPIVRAEELAKA